METNDYEKRFKTLVSALHKNAECPLCLETVKPPFKLCVHGHSICVECIKKLENCPLCQGKFVSENPVCVKNLLEALPHFCRYSDTGCEELVEPGNDHEMFCGYRPIVCRQEECSIKMPVVKVLDHYKSDHPDEFIIDELKEYFFFWYKNFTVLYTPVTLFENLFWIVYLNDDTKEYSNIFFEATPNGKPTKDYYVCIELKKKDKMTYAFTLRSKVLSSCEKKLVGNESEVLDDAYCMRIPRKELHRLADEEGMLEYTMDFFEVEH